MTMFKENPHVFTLADFWNTDVYFQLQLIIESLIAGSNEPAVRNTHTSTSVGVKLR